MQNSQAPSAPQAVNQSIRTLAGADTSKRSSGLGSYLLYPAWAD
jgi:hypothetical protein